LTASAAARNLPGAMLLDKDANVLEAAQTGIQQDFSKPPAEFIKNFNETEPEIVIEANYVAAVIRLRAFNDTFLYVARLLDPRVVAQLRQTQASVADYAQVESRRLGIQVAFALMFTVIALTILMSSVLIGLNFANWLVAPIRRLMGAANVVSTGDLNVQVPVLKSEGDLAQLGETFNKMTQELRTQRDELVSASEVIDSRRRFIEAVLSSASAGIIGVDASGSIGILNRSAEKLIGHAESETLGHPLSEIIPELDDMMKTAREGTQRLVQGQVTITRDGRERNLSVRVSAEHTSQSQDSYIITLDDITDLISAQRTSAWGDVARRIAHEIKNPLTPIQLSAERIRRKFGKVITEDKAIFEQCTDTIVRQVDDIRRMVDEFSRFARMPKPVMEGEDVADTVRQVVFLMRVGHSEIDIETEIRDEPMRAQFDRRLISQALTNIIKNATEAIEAVPAQTLGKGRIEVIAARDGDDIVIDVIDNGVGLPKVSRSRLLEPYVTTREKGTGLGLAIVGRVLEDHGGRIDLHDAAEIRPGSRGAWMRLRFAISGHAPNADKPNDEATQSKDETTEPSDATNNETKIEAATGS
ncbi:MAG TPA: PAS domain-containing sensor histidine kinase, partial [Bradyrhizobium sp.]|nr:PAS domain-containing sensor histidine kinase [Bradyrhizobium sp.]